MENKNEGLEVIRADEIKAEVTSLKSDITELQSQMAADKQATGLAIEERADDLQKALDAVTDITARQDEILRKVKQNEFTASFGETSAELKDCIDSFMTGFRSFDGDKSAVEHAAGTKPSIKHLVEGVFVDGGGQGGADNFHAPKHIAIQRLQKAHDDVYADHAMMMCQDASSVQEYGNRGGIKSLKSFKRFTALQENFTKATSELIDTVTEVANWIPTQYSSQMWEQVKIGLPVLTLFPEIQMSAATVVLPLDMNDNEAMRMTEVTTATNANPYADTEFVAPGAFASAKITFAAEKLRSRYWVSAEADEDAVITMRPFLNRKHTRNMGEAIEDAIINGQPTNIDTGGTHFSKANPLAATGIDARDCWDGLRRFAAQYTGSPATSADNANAKPTVVGMRGLRAAMGEYGTDPGMLAYLFGMFGYIKLLDDPNVLTVDKMGPNATVGTGVLGSIDGVDILVSRRIPENANATGIIDGVTTNRTLALAVHRESCILGNRRRITLGQTVHGSSDTTELFAFWRGDFQAAYPVATVPFVGRVYNIAAA